MRLASATAALFLLASVTACSSTDTSDTSNSSSSGGLTGSSSSTGGGGSSSSNDTGSASSSGGSSSSNTASASTSASSSSAAQSSSTASSSSSAASSSSSAASSSTASSSTGGGSVDDPALVGPFTLEEEDVSAFRVTGTSTNVNLFVVGPSVEPGPFPVVLMAPGFSLPLTQFKQTARHIASHGFVVVLSSYNVNFLFPDHAKAAQEVRGAAAYLAGSTQWQTRADLQNLGTTGHSLGGKLAVLVAAQDPRVKASITMDPVDGPNQPDASALLPLQIPMAFLGETTDAMSDGMACAPAAQNYTTFYEPFDDANQGPALEVTVLGANHMSFLDNVATCGFTCGFCNAATASNEEVVGLARSYLVSFFRRHLYDEAAYDSYLTGAEAQARYVSTNKVTLRSE
jgi:dienelactone hydrolase